MKKNQVDATPGQLSKICYCMSPKKRQFEPSEQALQYSHISLIFVTEIQYWCLYQRFRAQVSQFITCILQL